MIGTFKGHPLFHQVQCGTDQLGSIQRPPWEHVGFSQQLTTQRRGSLDVGTCVDDIYR